MADYFSFEDVMKELELGEDDLKRMVSEGELRAFRDQNKMKFKREDVDGLRKGRITEPTIILPSTPMPSEGGMPVTDETVLDLDIGQETAALSDTAPPDLEAETEPAIAPVAARPPAKAPKTPSRPAPKVEDDLMIQPEEGVGVETEETFIEEEADTGISTEPLKLADDSSETEETIEAEAVDAEVAGPARSRGRSGRTGAHARVGGAIPAAVEEEIEKKRAHPIWTFFIMLSFIASAYGGLFFYDQMRLDLGKSDMPSELTAGLAQWILEKNFWNDEKWKAFHISKFPEGKQPPFMDEKDSRIKHRPYDGPTFREPRGTSANPAVAPDAGGAAPAEPPK